MEDEVVKYVQQDQKEQSLIDLAPLVRKSAHLSTFKG